MSEEPKRPSPEALLTESRRETRGRLKVFLGAAPGVGKTYEMLSAARRRLREGVDLVVGIVETHGRKETEQLTWGLPTVPRRHLTHKGRTFEELDLDAILERHPALVLIDELAHTNVPGSRHEKRYQDVEEILDAGIDVYTTLNVQHLESLNDIVERISHVRVRETLPDRVLEKADDIELVDLPPEELLQRLREGKVYVPEQAQRAISHFFSRGNLMALRELSMRAAADRIDSEMLSYMQAKAIQGPWPTRDRLMVCISGSPASEQLIRLAKRIADRQQTPWIAAYVETGREGLASERSKKQIQSTLALAEELGGEAVTLSGQEAASELLAYGVSRNVTRILVGRPRGHRLPLSFDYTVPGRLLRRGASFEITVANLQSGRGSDESFDQEPPSRFARHFGTGRQYLEASAAVAAATGFALLLDRVLVPADLSLIFLTAVLVVALRTGLWPALYTAAGSFLAFNFLFTHPRFTFNVAYQRDLLTIVFFLVIAVLIAHLASRLRNQMQTVREGAKRNALLYDFSRRIARAVGQEDLCWTVIEYAAETLAAQGIVLLADAGGDLQLTAGNPGGTGLIDLDNATARWCLEHNEPAGRGTGTLPACRWYFVPIRATGKPLGVLGISFESRTRGVTQEERRLLMAMRDQAGVALERMQLEWEMEQTQRVAETEKLRSALLSSVSHDLRTPLVSIIGSASTLVDMQNQLSVEHRADLTLTILEEAERLNRFVQNLLDMTRLGYGALEPKPDWIDLRDVIQEARRDLQRMLAQHPLKLDIPATFQLIYADATLLKQVMANLLENAAKYSTTASPITIAAVHDQRGFTVRVTDEGQGIPPNERENVFNMFHRVKAGDSRVAGTGLGLSICRGIIEAMNGTIAATTGPGGQGTTIEITLPDHGSPLLPPAEEAAQESEDGSH